MISQITESETYKKTNKRAGTLSIFFMSVLFIAICLIAIPAQKLFAESTAVRGAYRIHLDEFEYHSESDIYILKGNTSIEWQGKTLKADLIHYNAKTQDAVATGNVHLVSGRDTMQGEKIEMNLADETGTIYNGVLFIDANHFYIAGDKIRKTGPASYYASKVSVTSCDGDNPAWKITGRDLDVTIEGYGTVKHSTLWAKKAPVLYTPYFVFPAKIKRQTGLLAPYFDYGSRNGFSYTQPFFWAISESSDATFYSEYIQERGEKVSAEYRYIINSNSKGSFFYDYLDDRKIDDGSANSTEEWGYSDDSYNRTNKSRYWFRMKHDQALPGNFTAKLDIDYVSDQDYLDEFQDGLTGYGETDDVFLDNYGRSLDNYDDNTRLNRVNISKSWSSYAFNFDTKWFDNVISRTQNTDDPTVQYLPQVDLSSSRQQLGKSPLYYKFDTEYTYLFRQDGSSTTIPEAHRADLYGKIYYPVNLSNYLALEPSVGYRQTGWSIARYSDDDTNRVDRNQHREIYDVEIDATSEIYRIFGSSDPDGMKIKHTLTPQVTYNYIPKVNQNDVPGFDSTDNIGSENKITYSVTNNFTAKTPNKTDAPDESGTLSYNYTSFSRFRVYQSYYIDSLDSTSGEEFSNISFEFDLTPKKYFSLDSDASWSAYSDRFITNNIALNLFDGNSNRISFEYRYDVKTEGVSSDNVESLITGFSLSLSGDFSFYGSYERDIESGEDIKSLIGLKYTAQCWEIDTSYKVEDDDKKIGFIITLNGLGGFGSN